MRNLRIVILIFLVISLLSGCGSTGQGGNDATSDNSGTTADTTKPTISSTSPTNNATGVSINASVSVTFSETMDTSTINDTTFTLKDGTTPVPCTITYSETTATLAPWNTLSYSTTYSASITTGAKDAAGNAMISNSIWAFTTESLTDAMATTTADATNITDTSVTLNGSFNNLIGDTTTVWFEYGITTSYGNSSISTAHTTAGNKSVSMNIAGLASYTTYHFRIVAQNSGGTYYGTDNIFATLKTPTVLATGASISALAVDLTSVFWIEGKSIKKVDINGGTTTTLASDQFAEGYNAIAVDSTSVYWTEGRPGAGGTVRQVDKNGGTVTILATGLSYPCAIAVDSTSVYWTEPYAGTIKKIGKDGGTITTLISGMNNNYALTVDTTSVYWTEGAWQQTGNNGAIRKMGVNGGMVTTLASGLSYPNAYAIAVDSNNVYWSEYNDWSQYNNSGAIKKVGINGGAVTTLASGLSYPYAIAVDSTNAYWTKYVPSQSGNIMTVGINGGATTTVASELTYPSAIVVDSTSVYWTELDSNGAVKKVEK